MCFSGVMRCITVIWISAAPSSNIGFYFIRLRSTYIYICISFFIIATANLICSRIWMNFKGLRITLRLRKSISAGNCTLLFSTLTLTCPRSINFPASGACPAILYIWRLWIIISSTNRIR